MFTQIGTLTNRVVASLHGEMVESIKWPKNVPQFLDEFDLNHFPLMSPEETHLDLATLTEKYDLCFPP